MATATTDPLTSIATLLGGTQTTSNAGNTDALQSVLAQLQAQNAGGYQQLLQSVFQQAAGAIPGLQGAYGNAVGARSGSNSAVQAALSELLKMATLEGQKQIVGQQNTNMGQQIQAGQSVAQATKGTTQQSGVNLGNAAKNLMLLQLFAKSGLGDKLSGGMNSLSSVFGSDATPTDMTGFSTPLSAPAYTPEAPNTFQSVLPSLDLSQFLTDTSAPDFSVPTLEDAAPAPDEWIDPMTDPDIDWGFADGGLVSRGPQTTSAPAQKKSAADNTLPREQLVTPQPTAPTMSDSLGGISLQDMFKDGSGDQSISFNGTGPNPLDRGMLGDIGRVNSISGATGGPSIEGLGGVLGLAGARNNQEALGAAGKAALGMVAPQATGLVGFAQNPSVPTGIDLAASLNPVTAIGNALLGLFGNTSIGSLIGGMTTSEAPAGSDAAGGIAGEAGNSGSAPGGGAANGGEIDGPGTGTSDSIPIRVSDGEYVMSKDVVDIIGVEFFDALQQALHTPVATQRRIA